jgi:inner membrane protein
MQLRDYSLIAGTIGIFIILAILMRVSTKINWYQFDNSHVDQ